MVMDMSFMNENYLIINNHFKCCGDDVLDSNNDNDEEMRRFIASSLLKEYIDSYYPDSRVIVLGATGRNFGAGMSGGIAYVYDEKGDFSIRCNTEMVALEEVVSTDDQQFLKSYIERHKECTDSSVADQILKDWASSLKKFIRVMPLEYRRVLEEQAQDLSVEAKHG